jgi:hypothetical protein
LKDLEKYVRCPHAQCTAIEIAKYMKGDLNIQFDLRGFAKSMKHRVAGIGQDLFEAEAVKDNCEESFAANEWMRAAGHAWPGGPNGFAPVLIKSHYPMIGDDATEHFTKNVVTKVIHFVRNPFDNLASRYMGENRKYEGRYNALNRAVAKGETTAVFQKFLEKDIDGYRMGFAGRQQVLLGAYLEEHACCYRSLSAPPFISHLSCTCHFHLVAAISHPIPLMPSLADDAGPSAFTSAGRVLTPLTLMTSLTLMTTQVYPLA